jgi:hypothetical protein
MSPRAKFSDCYNRMSPRRKEEMIFGVAASAAVAVVIAAACFVWSHVR